MYIASGKYIGLEIRNVRLVGQALVRVDIYYQTNSSGVYNADGVNVYLTCGTGYKIIDKLNIPYNSNTEKFWGTFDFYIDNSEYWFYLSAYCEDSVSPGSYPQFTATSPSVLGYKGELSYTGITAATANSCTVKSNVRNMYGEEMTYKNFNNIYELQNLNASSSDGSLQAITYTMSGISANTRFTALAGTVPNGGTISSPWSWSGGRGQANITYATTFTNMSMPTISIERQGTNIVVTWSGGGTTNKPQGAAARTTKLTLKDQNKGTLTSITGLNFEVAGSYTFTDIALHVSVYAQMEYAVTGLVDSVGAAKTYYQYSNEPYLQGIEAGGHIKVSGSYKKALETYVKVNGSYKKVIEGYIKVNGTYKKII